MELEKDKLLAGCVILYNPITSVINNIKSYLPFLGALYVIDNSEKSDDTLIKEIELIDDKIIYVKQAENIGIASALNIGAGLAFNEKYKWFLTMDQDSYFIDASFLDNWYADIPESAPVGLVAASYTNEYDRWQKDFSVQKNEIHFAVTSGNIINLHAWKEIGGFEGELFIDEVDHDYCLKLRKNNYKILISKKVVMGHMIGEVYNKQTNNSGNKGKVLLHTPLRYYYISRNVLYLCKKYFFIDFGFVVARFYYLVKALLKIVLIYPSKKTYLAFFFKGIRDFALSKYGKYKD